MTTSLPRRPLGPSRQDAAGAPVVALRDCSVRYGAAAPALSGVDLRVAAGERVGLVGPSGAGKSTLLGLLNATVEPTSGAVEVLGSDLGQLGRADLAAVRARIGTLYQHLHLVGSLRVVHNVNAGRLAAWPLRRALWSLVRPQGVVEARAALGRVGLEDRLFDRTDTLSGGQQQRVALARIVVQRPALVLADEPVSALDPVLAEQVMHLLGDLVVEQRAALVTSVHDIALARRSCDRLVGLRDGAVVFDRPAGAVDDDDTRALYSNEAGGAIP